MARSTVSADQDVDKKQSPGERARPQGGDRGFCPDQSTGEAKAAREDLPGRSGQSAGVLGEPGCDPALSKGLAREGRSVLDPLSSFQCGTTLVATSQGCDHCLERWSSNHTARNRWSVHNRAGFGRRSNWPIVVGRHRARIGSPAGQPDVGAVVIRTPSVRRWSPTWRL